MRRTGKAILLPAIGIVTDATLNGVCAAPGLSAVAPETVPQPASVPPERAAPVASNMRRRASVMAVSCGV